MKLKGICLVLLSIVSLMVAGQDRYMGFHAGINGSSASPGSAFETHVPKTGFSGGFTFEQFYKKKFSLGAEMLYNQRGYGVVFPIMGPPTNPWSIGDDTYYSYFDYLSLPLKANYYFGDAFFGFSSLAISPSFLVSSRTKFNGSSLSRKNINPTKFDLGGQIELGCGYKLESDLQLFISIHYYHGFTKVNNENYYATTDFRNANTNISVGFKNKLNIK